MKLSDLGHRICILGPSNSGKSTLANAIGRKCDLQSIHLDQLYHLPDTQWRPRPTEEFVSLHDAAIAGERWVMDGNYTKLLPQRLARATGIILLDVSTTLSVMRYINRTVFQGQRYGGLQGGKDVLNWNMFHHITVVTPKSRQRYANLFEQWTLPKLQLSSAKAIKKQMEKWDLVLHSK